MNETTPILYQLYLERGACGTLVTISRENKQLGALTFSNNNEYQEFRSLLRNGVTNHPEVIVQELVPDPQQPNDRLLRSLIEDPSSTL